MKPTYNNLILHIPHSSCRLFGSEDWIHANQSIIQEHSRLLIDWYTDELFVPNHSIAAIRPLVFGYNRILCDVERMLNDPLEDLGLGIRYDCILSLLPEDEGQRAHGRNLYIDHHAQLAKALNLPGTNLLLDCHSFSALPTLLCPNPPQDIDICIGYNDDETKPSDVFISHVCQYVSELGYRVGINQPYSNSKTLPVPHGICYHSLMIELNKSLYMNEQASTRIPTKIEQLKLDLQQIYTKIVKI